MTDDHHYWHTCSDCDHHFPGPTNAFECPICGGEAACRTGGECIDDSVYAVEGGHAN